MTTIFAIILLPISLLLIALIIQLLISIQDEKAGLYKSLKQLREEEESKDA